MRTVVQRCLGLRASAPWSVETKRPVREEQKASMAVFPGLPVTQSTQQLVLTVPSIPRTGEFRTFGTSADGVVSIFVWCWGPVPPAASPEPVKAIQPMWLRSNRGNGTSPTHMGSRGSSSGGSGALLTTPGFGARRSASVVPPQVDTKLVFDAHDAHAKNASFERSWGFGGLPSTAGSIRSRGVSADDCLSPASVMQLDAEVLEAQRSLLALLDGSGPSSRVSSRPASGVGALGSRGVDVHALEKVNGCVEQLLQRRDKVTKRQSRVQQINNKENCGNSDPATIQPGNPLLHISSLASASDARSNEGKVHPRRRNR